MRNAAFYPKLAFTNLKKNRKFYLPYILACVGTAAMFYIFCFLTFDKSIGSMPGAGSVAAMLIFGAIIIAIFAVIFLFYTNSFIMKRRKKEIGLYNVLGMGKRHIARVMAIETVYVGVFSIVCGIGVGILMSKLMLLVLCRFLHFEVMLGFSVSIRGIVITAILFGAIFVLTLLSNLNRVRVSKPVELLRGGSTGEREPKTRWLLAVVGVVTMAAGYYLALTVESPLAALGMFFVAVILVIVGTYCLFTATSIAVLKLLRRNKGYYYKTKHFTNVSGMLYRMKQNAVGLASICILCTMVLVTVSTTVSLYIGVGEQLDNRYLTDVALTLPGADEKTAAETVDKAEKAAAETGRTVSNMKYYSYLSFAMGQKNGEFTAERNTMADVDLKQFCVLTDSEYSRLSGRQVQLTEGSVLSYALRGELGGSFSLFGREFAVQETLDSMPVNGEYNAYIIDTYYLVVSQADFDWINAGQAEAYGDDASVNTYYICFDLDGTDKEKIACADAVSKATAQKVEETYVDGNGDTVENYYYVSYIESRQSSEADFYAVYGGFLFIGLFLGLLFLMATVLIIYYKQISEGYDDRARFEIMQKVGLSRREIKKTVHSQVIMVFFLPIAVAVLHLAGAFKMISKLLALFNLTNIALFLICTGVTVLAFCAIYGAVYALTAKTYYRIVSREGPNEA